MILQHRISYSQSSNFKTLAELSLFQLAYSSSLVCRIRFLERDNCLMSLKVVWYMFDHRLVPYLCDGLVTPLDNLFVPYVVLNLKSVLLFIELDAYCFLETNWLSYSATTQSLASNSLISNYRSFLNLLSSHCMGLMSFNDCFEHLLWHHAFIDSNLWCELLVASLCFDFSFATCCLSLDHWEVLMAWNLYLSNQYSAG